MDFSFPDSFFILLLLLLLLFILLLLLCHPLLPVCPSLPASSCYVAAKATYIRLLHGEIGIL